MFRIGSQRESEVKSGFPGPVVSKFLIPFGSVLIAAAWLLSERGQLSDWAVAGLIFYLVVIGGFSLFHGLGLLWAAVYRATLEPRLAHRFHSQLVESVKEFSELIEPSRHGTIAYLFDQANRHVQSTEYQIPLECLHFARSWAGSILKRLDTLGGKDFLALASDFSTFLNVYHYFCQRGQERLEAALKKGVIQEPYAAEIKQRWVIARERQMRLAHEWERVARKINQVVGDSLCVDNYEALKTF